MVNRTKFSDAERQVADALSRTCFPNWNVRAGTRIMRPERPEYSVLMGTQGDQAVKRRETVFRILGKVSVGPNNSSIVPFAKHKSIITAVAAILFDQESSSMGSLPSEIITTEDPAPISHLVAPPLSPVSMAGQSGTSMLSSLIEHMLLIDYNIAERPLRPLSDELPWETNYMTRVACHGVCHRLIQFVNDCRRGKTIHDSRFPFMDELMQRYKDESSADDDFSDVGLMFYYFWTRRRDINTDQYLRGMTGYKGVLEEIIAEIPTMGTDRLLRKLSVDVHKLIPRYVKDKGTRATMIAGAKKLAEIYELRLQTPRYAFVGLRRPMKGDSTLRIVNGQLTVRSQEPQHDPARPRNDPAPGWAGAMTSFKELK